MDLGNSIPDIKSSFIIIKKFKTINTGLGGYGYCVAWHINYIHLLIRILNIKKYIAKVQIEVMFMTFDAVVKIKFESTGKNSILVHTGWYLSYVLSLYLPTSLKFCIHPSKYIWN